MASARSTWDRLVAESALPRAEARALLELAAGRTRTWLLAHGDEPAGDDAAERFRSLVQRRRVAGEPLAYLVGRREFHGREFAVGPDVLIPRPETEGLVDAALELGGPKTRALDLGTGSGCVAVTLACVRPDWTVVGTDHSAGALARARANAARLCARALESGALRFRAGDWWQALDPGERFGLIVSNPPYVAAADPHLGLGDVRFEPPGALASGADGLDAIRVIVAGAPARLHAAGWLLLEHGFEQGAAVRALLASAGFTDVLTRRDAANLERITLGRKGRRAGADEA